METDKYTLFDQSTESEEFNLDVIPKYTDFFN